MVCYGCGIELFGYQSYKSMYCSQCLNRRAIEKQTQVQAEMAERQLELQHEQMKQMARERDRMEEQQYQQPSRQPSKKKTVRPLAVIQEEYDRLGILPDLEESSAAYDIYYKEIGRFVSQIIDSDAGKNARSYREIMTEYHDDPDGNLPDLSELITAALAHKKTFDERYELAVKHTREIGKASISALQRHLGTGYNDTAELVNEMELNGVVSECDGVTGVRRVLVD